MTEIITIRCLVSKSREDSKLAKELEKMYPGGLRQQILFTSELPNGDGRLFAILGVLDRYGWKPRVEGSKPISAESKIYDLSVSRQYVESDLEACDLFQFVPSGSGTFCGVDRDPVSKQVIIEIRELDKKGHFALASPETYVVSDKAVQLLDSSGLKGIVFQPTLLHDRRRSDRLPEAPPPEWEDYGVFPWYELTAEVELPPALKGKGRYAEGMLQVDESRGRLVCHGTYFGNYEVHYRASELAKLPRFDLARVAEHYDVPGLEHDRVLIASKRFYQFCRKHKLNASWVPVRIEPD